MIKLKPMFFAVSHGGSMNKPLIVNERTAKWLREQGVIVLTFEEYKNKQKG